MKGTLRRSLAYCIVSTVRAAALVMATTAFGQTAYIPNIQTSLHPPSEESWVSVVDTASGKVLHKIDVGLITTAVAATPDGSSVYVLNQAPDAVTVIDTARNAVKAIISNVPEPDDIAIAPDGSKAYVISGATGIYVIDTATNKVVKIIPLFSSGVVFSPDGTKAYATGNQGYIYVIDAASNKQVSSFFSIYFENIPNPKISPDGSRLYALNSAAKSVEIIDTSSGKVISPISFPKGIGSFAIAPNGTAYLLNPTGTLLSVFDTVKGKVTGAIKVGPNARNISFAGNGATAFVTTPTGVVVIDTTTNAITKTIAIGGRVVGSGSFIAPPQSPLTSTVLPAARSVLVGAHPTVEATLTNNGQKPLTCGIEALAPSANDLQLVYRPAGPSGTPTGPADTPVTIAAHATQSFSIALTSKTALAVASLPLIFECDGVTRAPTVTGLNTLDLAFSKRKTADVIAEASRDTITVPVNGSNSFIVSTTNAGAADTLAVSVDDGGSLLPLTVTLCPSNPKTHACLSAPAKSTSIPFAANAKQTFTVSVRAADYIPSAPDSRIFVRFKDKSGASRGLASVAVDTLPINTKSPPVPGPVYSTSFSATGNPRTQYCYFNTSYKGTVTVSLNPGSVTGKIKITGTGKATLLSNISGGSEPCVSGDSASLNAAGNIDLSSGKISWLTTAFGVVDRGLFSVAGSFSGTITANQISGTLTEQDGFAGDTRIPLTLAVKR